MTDTVVSNDGRPGTDVAIFVPSMRGGGAERAMLKLAIALSRSGVSLDLVLAKAEGAYIEDIPDDIRVVDLAASRIIASLPGLTAYLRSARPAVLLSSMDHANVVACWARTLSRARPRLVLNVQNTLSRSAADASMRRGRLVPSLARRTYPGAEAIVTVSKGVASDLADTIGIPRARIEVIHNPVVTPELIARSREPVEDEWFVPGADPVILAVGRLDSQKDYPTLLEAFAALRSRRAARLENPFAYMRHSSVYVMSSLYEGLPTVLIEALASGARIVSTDCPSGPVEILDGGAYGRLVPMSDSAALATALAAALDDDTPLPEPESWKPYELETVVEQYRRVLLGDGR